MATAKMVTGKPRAVVQATNTDFEDERFNAGLSALPGALVGLALGIIFIALADRLTASSAENIAIMGIIIVLPGALFGVGSHFFGQALLHNERPDSHSRIFDGNTTMVTLLHGGIWLMLFGAGVGLIVSTNPDNVIALKDKLVVFIPIRDSVPVQTTIPSSPGGGRSGGQRTLANAGGDEDPNKVKSSPNRFDRSAGNQSPAQQRAFATEQKKRDDQVVDSLKSFGFKVEGGVEYQDPKKP